MRALEFRDFGDPSHLHLVDRPDPHAGDDTAVVRVEAASVNPSDVKNVAGAMPQTTLPRVPGRDFSGVVVEGPADWTGVPVWGTGGDTGFTRDGTHAQLLVVPRASLVRKPESLSHEQAASSGVTFLTAWIAVMEYARLAKGETLAVIGAGGVGGSAIQLAKYVGARAIALTKGPLPADSPAAKLADEVFETAEGAHGVQADVVLNTVGGEMFETALQMAGHRGRVVVISPGQQRRVSFDVLEFYRNERQLFGVDSLKRDLAAASATFRELSAGFDSGALLAPLVNRVFPLEQAQDAYRLVAAGSSGRVVLRP
ncbi:MAG TPA: zinc-binding alcohol dehydrogenase family protein [Bryobacteraceae bacterium]|jgi:NADPH:quinone reductase-like Zn-dependent oxidoreductase|nr:zinc-binding alcohol dehydrogenase family protein [Bryobacteraceae bacterium]